MGSTNINNENQDSFLGRVWSLLFTKVTGIVAMLGKIARDEPRRVTHSLKVGLAITLVSLLYYFQPSYKSFGSSAMWAIMTVVVVNEFTVGATLGKGLNRAMATFIAGGLGVGAHHLASLCGNLGRHFVVGFFVFLLASVTTFMRFSPKIKARYDYGFSIFILTFCFISISGYRAVEIIEVAHKRLSTTVIGVSLSLLINILIFPVWAGEKLHNSIISLNMENLGHFLQEFGTDEIEANSKDESKSFLQGYKNVLNSKSLEESLANFARWEPRHGKFRYRHPWNEYVKLGAQIRQCAYRIDALSAHFNLDILASKELPREIGEECIKMSLGSGKALKELGSSFKKMNQPCSSIIAHIVSSKAAIKALKSLLKRGSIWKDCDLVGVIPIANIVSLLVDVDRVDKIATTVYDIANLANFKRFEGSNLPPKKPRFDSQQLEVVNKDSDCSEIVIIAVAELE